MKEDVRTAEAVVAVVEPNALQRAALQTLSRLTRLRMRVPEGSRACEGDRIVITDAERSYKVLCTVEAVEAGVMLVDPFEVVSTARSYRAKVSTPHGP